MSKLDDKDLSKVAAGGGDTKPAYDPGDRGPQKPDSGGGDSGGGPDHDDVDQQPGGGGNQAPGQ